MELELEQTLVRGCACVAESTLFPEETLEMIVPDACPDIGRILDTQAWVELGSHTAGEGRMELSGTVRAAVLYLPEGEEGPRKLEASIPFHCGGDSPRVTTSCTLTVQPRVEQAETRMLNPRKVLLRTALALDVQGWLPQEEHWSSGVIGEGGETVEQLQEPCRTYGAVWVGEKPFSFEDEVALPGTRPVMELLRYRLTPRCGEAKVIGSKLLFKGEAELSLLCREEEGSVRECRFQLPFSQILETGEAGEECDCSVEVLPVSVSCELDGEGRNVQVVLELLAQAVLREERSFSLLTDLYSTAWALEADPRPCTLEHRVDSSIRTQTVREVLECPVLPAEVVDARAYVGRTTQSREGSRLTLTAPVEVTVLFRDEDGALDVAVGHWEVPCTIEAEEAVNCRCHCRCPEPVGAAATASGVEVRFPVEFQCLLTRREERMGVSAARLDTETPRDSGPSIVLRLPQRGERLWDIAKCYGTTASEICQANHLEEGTLPDGQILLIPRTRA